MPRSTRSVAYVGRRSEPLPEGYVVPASVMQADRDRLNRQADRKALAGRLSSPDRSVRTSGSRPSPWAGHYRPRPLSSCLTSYMQAVADRDVPGPNDDPSEARFQRPEAPGEIVTRQDRQGRTSHVLVVEPLR